MDFKWTSNGFQMDFKLISGIWPSPTTDLRYRVGNSVQFSDRFSAPKKNTFQMESLDFKSIFEITLPRNPKTKSKIPFSNRKSHFQIENPIFKSIFYIDQIGDPFFKSIFDVKKN